METDVVSVHTEMTCTEARWQLCRLAAGSQLRRRALALARHVHACEGCDGFADRLAGVRGRLAARWVPAPAPPAGELHLRARAALARELRARLARDLLGRGQGQQPRPAAERALDLRRLALLDDEAARRGEVSEIEDVLAQEGRADRGRALELACRLDPLGLDLALALLGHLERRGDPARAHDLAERLLADVP